MYLHTFFSLGSNRLAFNDTALQYLNGSEVDWDGKGCKNGVVICNSVVLRRSRPKKGCTRTENKT